MNQAVNQTFKFNDVELDKSRCSIRRGEQEQHLRQKSFQVLVYLLERRERFVTKSELMATVWKDTAVTDDALVQCVKEIRRALGDDSHHPRFIKTIPKVGYRFISQVEENPASFPPVINTEETAQADFEEDAPISANGDITESKSSHNAITAKQFHYRSAFVLTSIALLIGILYFVPQILRSNKSPEEIALPYTPGKKAVAVMYFDNQSKTAELDWLREGLTDMLIADLSRSSQLTVLSRGQLHLILAKIRAVSSEKIEFNEALEIARKSKAEEFVTGSFSKIGDKVRVDIQLHDTATGNLQASESLLVEKPEQILSEIDLLSLRLLSRLKVNPNEKERQSGLSQVMTNNLEAYRYYSLGLEKVQALHNKEAIELLEKAVALDPQFAMAHARIGYTYAVTWGFVNKGKPHLERAFQLSERLTEKDRLQISAWYAIANLDFDFSIQAFRKIIAEYPNDTESYWRLGHLLIGEERTEEAISVLKQGLAVDPEARELYNTLGGVLSSLRRYDEALAARQRYVALAPAEPNAYDSLGLVYQSAGNYTEAIAQYNRALELNPRFDIAIVHLANTRFQLGQYREAINLFERYIKHAPSDNERSRGYNCLAIIYRKLNNQESAEKAARLATKYVKEAVWESFVLALERQDFSYSEKLKEQIFAKSPYTNRGARTPQRFEFYYRGYIALKNGETEAALANFKKALQHLPPIWNIEDFEDCLANALLTLGKLDEAAAEYQRILQFNPNYPLAHFHLAQIYQQKEMPDESRAFFERFLQIWKDADSNVPEVIIAKQKLKTP